MRLFNPSYVVTVLRRGILILSFFTELHITESVECLLRCYVITPWYSYSFIFH